MIFEDGDVELLGSNWKCVNHSKEKSIQSPLKGRLMLKRVQVL